MGLMITYPTAEPEFGASGFAYTKRDSTPYVKKSCTTVAHMITYDEDPTKIQTQIKQSANELLNADYSDLSLTCEMNNLDEYKHENYIQVQVAKKQEQRTKRKTIPGSRLKYVVVANKSKKHYDHGEEYEYAKNKKVKLDYEYYLKQFTSNMKQITSQNPHIDVDKAVKDAHSKAKRKAAGVKSIMSFITKKQKKK